ncbi:MAG: phospho-sugar mutase [Candidatus Brocadiae bacterium]|nr:phospho-sugar mutase [Candidatus Brocadiia bacterium]
MLDSKALNTMCELLEKKYGNPGKKAAENLREWIGDRLPCTYPEQIAKHLEEKYLDFIFDAFWQILPFGTGGRRGKVGYGPNRMNPTTVAMTVQGHCQYLKSLFPDAKNLAVVVANDVRVFNDIAKTYSFLAKDHPLVGVSSRSLAKLACEIYAGNGITAYFADPENNQAVLSTPELSFLISELKTVGGVNLSASHNPPDDNGIKVYDQYGSQPVAPYDQILTDAMNKVSHVASMPFTKALSEGKIQKIAPEYHEKYIQTYIRLYNNVHKPDPKIPIVYTPMCGCGLTTVGEVLTRLGFPYLTPSDQKPDGSFAVIPFKAPNPEVFDSTRPARDFADQNKAGIVLSSDPDADRIGVEIKLANGSWYHLDGNQIASVLCYFLMLDPNGPKKKGLVLETLVTTKIIGKIVEKRGGSWIVDDLLVGFKHMAHVLKTLAKEGKYKHVQCSPDDLVLATEESHGVLLVPSIKDKDSVPAAMYFAALYQMLHKQGKNILDYYIQMLEELGGYDNVNRSIMMSGAQGMLKQKKVMEALRENLPKTFGGYKVNKISDYWNEKDFGPFASETDRLPRNVLQIFTDAFVITIRPSGTEPKLKFYCQLLPHGEKSSLKGQALLSHIRSEADKAARVVYNEILAKIGCSMEEEGLLLPDIVDLDNKIAFQKKTVPALLESLQSKRFAQKEEALQWLKQEAAAMTPGADPLPALKKPLAYLCDLWQKQLPSCPVLASLKEWTKG